MTYTLIGRIEVFAQIARKNTVDSLLKFLEKEKDCLCVKEDIDPAVVLFGGPGGQFGDGKIGADFPDDAVQITTLEDSVRTYYAGAKDTSYLLGLYSRK